MFTVGKLSLKWGGENLGEQHCRAHVAGIKAKAQSARHYITPLSGITSKRPGCPTTTFGHDDTRSFRLSDNLPSGMADMDVLSA